MLSRAQNIDWKLIGVAVIGIALGAATAAILVDLQETRESPAGDDAPQSVKAPEIRDPQTFSPGDAGPGAYVPAGNGAAARRASCPSARRAVDRLFADANVRPAYQGPAMQGVRLLDVRSGSFWDELGIVSGDLIIERAGEPIDRPEASVNLLDYLAASPSVQLRLRATNGTERAIVWQAPEPTDPATLPEDCR